MDIIIPNTRDEDTGLVLPINKNELGNFIYGLLGQQQSIEREMTVKFDINHDWIINLHELINQRIHMQADAKLVSFSSVIYFEHGLKRTFTSFAAFQGYSENKKILPVGIKIIWNYLVPFPNRKFPEKQQITFSAFTRSTKDAKVNSDKPDSIESFIKRNFIYNDEQSTIRFQIDHTERTWGDDLEVIISNHVNEIARKNAKSNVIFQLSRVLIALFIFFGGTFFLTFPSIGNVEHQIITAFDDYEKLKDYTEISLELISHKIDSVVNILSLREKRLDNFRGAVLGSLAMGIMALTVLALTRKQTYSFLVFTKEAIEYRARKLKKERRSNIALAMSFILSVIAGVVANYGYSWLIN